MTISPVYAIIKTMERDFWNGNHPLGHMTLLVPPMKGLMIMTDLAFRAKGYPGNKALYAKGLVKGDGAVSYLWGYGNYKYEIERIVAGADRLTFSDVFESSYEEAMIKFEKMVDKVVLL